MMWKTILRVIVLVSLMAVAVTMVAFTAADFQKEPAAASGAYVVADYGGSVAVFDRGDSTLSAPLQVTEIRLAGLRAADRAMIETGVPVSSREELMALLEDLGS